MSLNTPEVWQLGIMSGSGKQNLWAGAKHIAEIELSGSLTGEEKRQYGALIQAAPILLEALKAIEAGEHLPDCDKAAPVGYTHCLCRYLITSNAIAEAEVRS